MSHSVIFKSQNQPENSFQDVGDLVSNVVWPELKPKHTFLMYYSMIIRQVGSLAHCTTLRLESKNGFLKKKVQQGNNLKMYLQQYLDLKMICKLHWGLKGH